MSNYRLPLNSVPQRYRSPIGGQFALAALSQNAPTPFPSSIPGLLARYKAEATGVVLTNGKVSSWLDQSGNNNHAAQTVSTNQPILVANALNQLSAIRFDGNDTLSLTTALTNQTFTIFCILKSANSQPLTLLSAGGGSFQYRIHTLKQELVKAAVALVGTGNTTMLSSTFNQINITYSTPTLSFRTNSISDGIRNSPSTFNTPTINRIGMNGASSDEFFVGDIVELLIYTALNLEQIQAIEAYLSSRMSIN